MSFTNLDTVALYLNKLSATDLSPLETAQLSILINQVDGIIQNYCGWNILETDYTNKKYDGNGTSIIDLEAYPLTAISSVTMDGEDITSIIETENDDGYLNTTDSSTFTTGTNNVVVSYTAGFADDAIPSDLTYAATYLVVLNYKKIKTDMFGISKGKFNTVEVELESSNLPMLVQNVLDQYLLVLIR
jgi:hypothetical protein